MSKLSIAINAEDHIQGDPAAECSLVEYGDYECPHCGAAYPIVKRVQRHFGRHLKFVFRNFPMSQMHPWAEPAAEVAEFAGAHGKFWEMHDLIFENQQRLGNALFAELAESLDLSPSQLFAAVAAHTYRTRVRADFAGGARSGVNGTPTFFINGKRNNGPFDFGYLSEAIQRALDLQMPSASD
jgi:protein-disulfide isomerase